MLLHMVSALALVPLLISRAAAWTLPPQGLILRADNSPGLGIEFEYRQITLGSDIQTTTAGDLKKVKGAVIILNNNEVKGDNWELTAEHESETSIGLLTPEWIIDGKTVALGSGQATKATSEIIDQMNAWQPCRHNNDPVSVKGFDQYKWKIKCPGSFNPGSIQLGTQVTAPLPLEAVQDLFLKARAGTKSSLIGTNVLAAKIKRMHVVQRSHLNQDGTFPTGITPSDAPDDVLGFLSLLVSYAKYADKISASDSPKMITPIMPRTDFLTIFNGIRDRLPVQECGPLFDLVKDLAVFKGDGTDDLDPDFSIDDQRRPSNRMDSLHFSFENSLAPGNPTTLLVSEWVNGLQSNKDMLTEMDKIIDGQIGGLGSRTESVLGTSRLVPIFELRDLTGPLLADTPKFVDSIEQAIVGYHNSMKDAPKTPARRDARALVGRSGDSCRRPKAPMSTTAPPAPNAANCTHQADPDNDDNAGECVCSGGTPLATTTVKIASGNNPCPWTAMPITSGAEAPPAFTAPPQTGKALFTETRAKDVIACSTSVVSRSAGADVTTCAQPTLLVSSRPHATVQLGYSTQGVGTLSASALSATITSALSQVCPTPAPGKSTACTASAKISGIHYTMPKHEDNAGVFMTTTELLKDGTLVVGVPTSNYTSTEIRDSMFKLAGGAFARSANITPCSVCDTDKKTRRDLLSQDLLRARDGNRIQPLTPPVHETLYNTTNFAGVQYMNEKLNPGNPAAFMDVQLSFHIGQAEQHALDWDCGAAVSLVEEALTALGPELQGLDIEVGSGVEAVCIAIQEH